MPSCSQCFMSSGHHCSDHAHAVKCELAGAILRSCGTLRLQVTGWSMLPAVWPGDILLVESATAGDLMEGDIILFGQERRVFAHRIVKRFGNSSFLTRGDAMPQDDPRVCSEDVLGRVSSIIRNGKHITLAGRRGVCQRLVAGVARRSHLATRLLVGMRGRGRE